MRKITREAVQAFNMGNPFKKQNMEIVTTRDTGLRITKMYLHGNLIAELTVNPSTKDQLYISNCGWYTNTTKERLNGVLETFGLGKLKQKKGQWYYITYKGNIYNGEETQELFEGSKYFNI